VPTAAGLKGFGDGSGGEVVLSESKLRQLVGSGRGDTTQNISTTINARPGQSPQQIAQEVQRILVRQEQQSGILFNATMVRQMIENRIYETPLLDMSFPDFQAISGADFLEKVEECYSKYGKDDVIVITRSNKRAVHFNQGIRARVLYAEEEIDSGDMLMVVKNNYHYTERDEEAKASFIANGDVAQLRRIRRFKELYGFRFAEATLRFPDYDDYEIECNILLDALNSFSPSLTREQMKELFYAVEADYPEITCKAKRMKEVRENEYYNAMQVKFAYAVTCHKAQGGQWSAVFIDRLLFGEERMTKDFLRWLYTAISRATSEVYLVNFDDSFFDPTTYDKED
jgi:exodeoxyribonuclease-5